MLFLGISLLLVMMHAAPATATSYPYCVKNPFWGHSGECMYSSRSQCEAAVRGTDIVCGKNVRLQFSDRREPIEEGLTMSTEEQIRNYARQLWEKAGCPQGRDEEFRHAAEVELNAESESPDAPTVQG